MPWAETEGWNRTRVSPATAPLEQVWSKPFQICSLHLQQGIRWGSNVIEKLNLEDLVLPAAGKWVKMAVHLKTNWGMAIITQKSKEPRACSHWEMRLLVLKLEPCWNTRILFTRSPLQCHPHFVLVTFKPFQGGLFLRAPHDIPVKPAFPHWLPPIQPLGSAFTCPDWFG